MPGFTLWLTGLSGAGKSTIAELVSAELERRGLAVELLDGDIVRTHLSSGLGFSRADRDTNVARIAWVASRLNRHGAAVIVAAISPYAEARDHARALVQDAGGTFVEVFVDAPVDVCAERDVKGLYAAAARGEIAHFTGVSDPYEPPARPDVHLRTRHEDPHESADRVLADVERRGLVATTAYLSGR